MATKFLPFVTPKSTPTVIFKALAQRSKGVRPSKLANLYAIILKLGLDEVRSIMDDMHEALTAKDRIEQLVNTNREHEVSIEKCSYWSYLIKSLVDQEKMDSFALPEQEFLLMASVMALVVPAKLEETGIVKCVASFDTPHENVSALKHVKFVDDPELKIGFSEFTELLAYVSVKEYRKEDVSLLPVLVEKKSGVGNEQALKEKNCKSPYE